jgi:hypothetical protein
VARTIEKRKVIEAVHALEWEISLFCPNALY